MFFVVDEEFHLIDYDSCNTNIGGGTCLHVSSWICGKSLHMGNLESNKVDIFRKGRDNYQ